MSNRRKNQPKGSPVVVSEKPANLELTAYTSGPAVVRERREVTLAEGRNDVSLGGLPVQYVPNSFTVVSVEGKGTFKLGPRRFRPANLNDANILRAYLGQEVTLFEQTAEGLKPVRGVLARLVGNQAYLELAGGRTRAITLSNNYEVPGGIPETLSDVPSLLMKPTVSEGGRFAINGLYETQGVQWTPRGEIFYDAKAEKITRFLIEVDLTNNSGTPFDASRIKLIAGHNPGGVSMPKGGGMRMAMAAAAPRGGSHESFQADAAMSYDAAEVESVGEQKMYTLPEALCIEHGTPDSAVLVCAENVPVVLEYYLPEGSFQAGVRDEELEKLPVSVRLCVKNDKASNLGVALPRARVRVLEPDSSGALQKTDTTDIQSHVAVDEGFRLDLNNPSRDLKATRKQTFYKLDPEVEVPEESEDDSDSSEVARPSIGTLGGPDVGTPDEHSRRRRDAAEGAGKKRDKKNKKKVVPPRFCEEERQVTVHNYKDKDVTVLVHEDFPHNAEFLSKSQDFSEQAQSQGTFKVTVPAKGKAEVTYRIKWRVN